MSDREIQARSKRRLCVFTGTRAEYGLLRPLMQCIQADEAFELCLIVSGAHLAPSQGETVREIERDGFRIDERVEILADSRSADGVATAMGLGLMRYATAFGQIRPDAVLILGDRFEAFAAAAAAVVHRVPIIHLHGGETTLGAIDEMFRHAITKMANVHLTSTEAYRRRVVQLGEDPASVFNVGALGVVNATAVPRLSRAAILERLKIPLDCRFILATFHPATSDDAVPADQLAELMTALDSFQDYVVVFTGANADQGGRALNDTLVGAATREPLRFRFSQSLGLELYINAAREAEVVIGNSSSGVIEVPSLKVPVVDIGSRQEGRIRSEGVLHAPVEANAIKAAIQEALSDQFRASLSHMVNPYERIDTLDSIMGILRRMDLSRLTAKKFHDIDRAEKSLLPVETPVKGEPKDSRETCQA